MLQAALLIGFHIAGQIELGGAGAVFQGIFDACGIAAGHNNGVTVDGDLLAVLSNVSYAVGRNLGGLSLEYGRQVLIIDQMGPRIPKPRSGK